VREEYFKLLFVSDTLEANVQETITAYCVY